MSTVYAMMRLFTDCILILCGLIQVHSFQFDVKAHMEFADAAAERSVLDKINRYLRDKAQHPTVDGPIPYRMQAAMAGTSEELPAFNSKEIQRWLAEGKKYSIPRLRDPPKPAQTVLQEINSKDLMNLHLFGSDPQHDDYFEKQAPKNFISV